MNFRDIKDMFKSYQTGPLAQVVAVLASIQQSLKHRSAVLIYVDKDGDWHNRRRDATFVTTELHALSFEAVEEAVMDQWCYDYSLKDGDVAVDLGAGVGDDAVVFSKLVGPKGLVIAIEAHPRTFRCLIKTIKSNGLNNVIPINVGVSDRNGKLSMSDRKSYHANSIVTGGRMIEVKTRRLDDILSELSVPSPTFVKMNIEGAETAALRGMDETLRLVPHIVVSCHDFVADGGGDPVLRTLDNVKSILQHADYDLRATRKDPRPWFRYYLYGKKRGRALI